MKKFFEKHTVAKLIGIFLFLTIVLTWIIPYSGFQGSTLVEGEKYHIGFNDLGTIFSSSLNFVIDKVIFILALGGFYAIITKTSGYNKLVSKIVEKIKGVEIIFAVVMSVILTLITSVFSQPFAVLLFVPFILSILLNSGIRKIDAFAATFGAIIVGILGVLFSNEGLVIFDTYFSSGTTGKTGAELTLGYRAIILGISLVLYNFMLVRSILTNKNSKKNTKNNDDIKGYEIASYNDKKTKVLPTAIILILLSGITILGFVDWSGMFKLNAFKDFHTWLTGLKIGKDFTIFKYILGNTASAFGTWNLLTLSIILLIISLIVTFMNRISFDDLFSSIGEGITKVLKSAGVIIAVYMVFITTYMSGIVPKIADTFLKGNGQPTLNIDYNGAGVAIFNVDINDDNKADVNLINQDSNKDGKCDLNCDTNSDGFPDELLDFNYDGKSDDDDALIQTQLTGKSILNYDSDSDGVADVNLSSHFSLAKAVVGATVTSIFNTDFGYTGYTLGTYLSSSYSSHISLIFVVFIAIYGLLQFFIPTSAMLMFGLTYADITYKEWMKYIWRFVLATLCVLLIMFIFMII